MSSIGEILFKHIRVPQEICDGLLICKSFTTAVLATKRSTHMNLVMIWVAITIHGGTHIF